MLEIIVKSLRAYIEESKKSDQKILKLMKQNKEITIIQICDKLHMSESGVKK